MTMTVPIPTGVFDILPDDPKDFWKSSHLWQYVEKSIREHAAAYCCREIRTPIFERTELFCRSVGDETDIVAKEMYTFEDRGGRSLSLRPEGTAPVMRAFIDKQLQNISSTQRFFYIGPMFRYERPQSGRFRQHHQFGVEFIGSAQAEADAELIELLYSLYVKLGITNMTVHLNSLGDKDARLQFRNSLKDYLRSHFATLSKDSQTRFENNPLRILDSKDEQDAKIIKHAPSILDFLKPECRSHFEKVQAILKHLKIPFEINPLLVRGLDYYNRTVFEITTSALGAQNTIGGGGRYDGLMKDLGGLDLPGLGFGSGIERIIQTVLHQHHERRLEAEKPELYIIPLGDAASFHAFSLIGEIRKEGIMCYLDTSGKKLKNAMQSADSSGAKYTLVLGENEIAKGEIELKEMKTGKTVPLRLHDIAPFFKLKKRQQALNEQNFAIKEELAALHTETAKRLLELVTIHPV